jgi:hypothetical protein
MLGSSTPRSAQLLRGFVLTAMCGAALLGACGADSAESGVDAGANFVAHRAQ